MRASQPGKMPGFFVSRSRENSMTLAERLMRITVKEIGE